MLINIVHYMVSLLVFIIPMAWWTRLNANYYSTKLTLLFFAGALAWLAIPSKISLLKLPKVMFVSLMVIILYQIGYHTYTLRLDDFLYLSKFLSFSALVVWVYAYNKNLEDIYKKSTYLIFLTASMILGISLYELYNRRIIDLSTDVRTTLSTFGNVNMFAEFLVLSLPFIFHWSRYKDKIPNFLKLVFLSMWTFFTLYCNSRSAWIGLVLWIFVFLRYKISKKETLAIGIAFLCYAAFLFLPANLTSGNNGSDVDKMNSKSIRIALYEATFELIKDNPWGIEVGRFMGEIEPYQMNSQIKPTEFNYYDQPHSEILKWGSQFGWLFLAVALVFIFSIVLKLGPWFFHSKNSFFVESFMVLLPQMVFQFPFENPASLVYLSVVFGLFFREYAIEKSLNISIIFRPLLFILFLAGLYSGAGFVNSVYQESTFPRNESIISACEYYPINIKACHAKLAYYLDHQKYNDFLNDFKIDFVKEPFFIDYLRLLPTYYSIKQNAKKTCESLFLYKTIFPEQKAFDKKYYDGCLNFTNIFYFDSPQNFKTRYLTWLDNLN